MVLNIHVLKLIKMHNLIKTNSKFFTGKTLLESVSKSMSLFSTMVNTIRRIIFMLIQIINVINFNYKKSLLKKLKPNFSFLYSCVFTIIKICEPYALKTLHNMPKTFFTPKTLDCIV